MVEAKGTKLRLWLSGIKPSILSLAALAVDKSAPHIKSVHLKALLMHF